MVRCVVVTLLAFAFRRIRRERGPSDRFTGVSRVGGGRPHADGHDAGAVRRTRGGSRECAFDAGRTLDAAANADAVSWIAERWLLP